MVWADTLVGAATMVHDKRSPAVFVYIVGVKLLYYSPILWKVTLTTETCTEHKKMHFIVVKYCMQDP